MVQMVLDKQPHRDDAIPGVAADDAIRRKAEEVLEGHHRPPGGRAKDAVYGYRGDVVPLADGPQVLLHKAHIVPAAPLPEQHAGVGDHQTAGVGNAHKDIVEAVPGGGADNPICRQAKPNSSSWR